MEELLWALLALSNVVLDEGTSWATAVEVNGTILYKDVVLFRLAIIFL